MCSSDEQESTLPDRIADWLNSGGSSFHYVSDSLTPETAAMAKELAARYEAELSSEEAPRTVGPWVLGKLLGRGGAAEVREARNEKTDETVALKIMPALPASVDSLKSEALGLLALDHPHIIRCSGWGVDDGYAWLATEVIEGQTLASWLAERRGRELRREELRQIIVWFRDLALALQALHDAGRIHRDLKPSNVMISSEGRAYLIDFGLSVEGEGTLEGWLAGTVPYMSPEQTLAGYVDLGPASDVYGLAITFHEALTGRRVIASGKRRAILEQVAFATVPAPSKIAPWVPRSLDPLFLRATTKNAKERHRNAGELAQDLDAWLDGRALAPATRRHDVAPKRRRLALAFGLAMALGAFFVVRGWRAGQREERSLGWVEQASATEHPGRESLDLLDRALVEGGGSEVVRAHIRESLADLSPKLARDLLARQAFRIAGRGRESDERLTSKMESLFRLRPDPHLLFCRAFVPLMEGDNAAAIKLLDEAPKAVSAHWLCRELRVLNDVLQGQTPTIPEELQGGTGSLGELELCLRAFRVTAQLLASRNGPSPPPSAKSLARVRSRLLALSEEPGDHRLAGALLCRLLLESSQWARARTRLGQLRVGAISKDEEAVIDLFSAQATLFEAENRGGDAELLALALSCAQRSLDARPELADRLAHEVSEVRNWQLLASFLGRLMPLVARGETLPDSWLNLLAWCGDHAFQAGNYAELYRIAAPALALLGVESQQGQLHCLQLRNFCVWARFYALKEGMSEAQAAAEVEAAASLAAGRRCQKRPFLSYQIETAAAHAESWLAEHHPSRDRKDRALRRATRLQDPKVLDRALADASGEGERAVIESCHDAAARIEAKLSP